MNYSLLNLLLIRGKVFLSYGNFRIINFSISIVPQVCNLYYANFCCSYCTAQSGAGNFRELIYNAEYIQKSVGVIVTEIHCFDFVGAIFTHERCVHK